MNLKSTFSLTKEQKTLISKVGDVHVFLKTKFLSYNPEVKTSFFGISQVSESFDYKRSLRISINVLRLITNIIKSRQLFMNYKVSGKTEPEKIRIGIYNKSNVKEIFKIDISSYFKFKIDLPTVNPK